MGSICMMASSTSIGRASSSLVSTMSVGVLRHRGVEPPSCGAITFVQRFGSALQLNVHFHVLVPDGDGDAHCARERSELAKCPVPTDDGLFVADEPPTMTMFVASWCAPANG
jgi:hypothetical protein